MNYKDLFKALKQGDIKSLYLFTGPEQLLIRQALDRIIAAVVEPDYAEFNLIWIDGEEVGADRLFSDMETLPFFQDRKIIIVKDAPYFKSTQDKLSDVQKEKLEKLLSAPSADTVLVFLAPQTDKRKKVSKALSANGVWISFDALERSDFEKWLTAQVASGNHTISAAETKYLAEVTGYLDKGSERTLQDIATNLEKLFGYLGNTKEVTRESIDVVFEKPLEYNIFAMVDHVADGKISNALSMLRELQMDGEADIKILFMIARHYRILLRMILGAQEGLSEKDLGVRAGVQPFLVKKNLAQAKRIGFQGIKNALYQILDADRAMKTGRVNPEIGLEMLMIQLSVRPQG